MTRFLRLSAVLSSVALASSASAATPVVWSCAYWSNATKTAYYSASREEIRNPKIDYMTDSRARRLRWVAHLQQLGVDPGQGGSCDGVTDMQESVAKRESSKAFYAANYNGRSVDTGHVPIGSSPEPSQPVSEAAPRPHPVVETVKPTGPTPAQMAEQAEAQREAERAQAEQRARAAAAAAPTVDPAVFGLYAQLVGARVQGPRHSGLAYAWSLGGDGTIVQDRVDPDDRQYIRPDGPGRLLLVNNAGKAQQGRVEPDGSVVWHWPKAREGVRFSIRGGQVVFEQVLVNRDGTTGESLSTKVLQGSLPAPPQHQPVASAPVQPTAPAAVAPAGVAPAAVAQAAPQPVAPAAAPVKGGGMPLRFILQVGLRTVINGSNASCYSNIITVPGPPGWPDPTPQQRGTLPARALVEGYIDAFKAKCGAIAPLAGSVDYQWNMKGAEHISPEKTEAFARRKGFPFVDL